MDVFGVSMGIVILVNVYSIFTRNRRFHQETGIPVMLACSGIALGTMLQDDLWGIACVIAPTVIIVVNWKKLIDRVASLFRTAGVK